MRRAVTYGCEAWTLTSRDEQHLRLIERTILRKIFGPVQNGDGSWRTRMNYELNEIVENEPDYVCRVVCTRHTQSGAPLAAYHLHNTTCCHNTKLI